MPELPYDIWKLIADLLPDDQVQRLYSVNRTLFNIAMDLRYQQVSLGVFPDRVVEDTQRPMLRNPLLFSRPTDLQITFYDSSNPRHSGPKVCQTKSPSLLSSFRNIINTLMGRKSTTLKPAQIAGHVARLTRVTKLSFSYAKSSSHNSLGLRDVGASLMFRGLVSTFGNRLRGLHIQSPFVLYLPPQFEALETFSLDASRPYHTPEIHKIMLEKIPGFLLTQSSTIRCVSFSIDNCSFDIVPILRCLALTPYLLDLNLMLPLFMKSTRTTTELGFALVRDVLQAHQRHLRSLDLRFTADDSIKFFSYLPSQTRPQEWQSFILPNLRNMTIHIPGAPFACTWEPGPYVQHFSPSLVSLTIKHQVFSMYPPSQQIKDFCKLLGNFPCLQDLGLAVYTFEIQHLTYFASGLPCLRSLFVDYSFLSLDLCFELNPPPELFDWALESFDYKCSGPRNLMIDSAGQLGRKVAIYLPNLLWIHKKARSEYLDGQA